MGLRDRLLQYIDYLGIDKASFERSCGLSNDAVSKMGDNTRTSTLDRISKAYPRLNMLWLRAGIGEMEDTQDMQDLHERIDLSSSAKFLTQEKKQGVPYYENIEATCGIVTQYNDYPETPTFFINYEHFNDCTAYLPVVGDSMYPQYCSGEIIAVKKILNMDIIQWGEAYFIITNDSANNLKTIKQVHPCDDASKIILRASNPNFKGDTIISKEDIVSLFIIKGKIKRNQL